KPADWPHRLQLAAPPMIAELAVVAADIAATDTPMAETSTATARDPSRLLLVSRREHARYNSVAHDLPALKRRLAYNPAHLNPADAARLGIIDGAVVEIESGAGRIRAIAHLAPDVREGVVSIAHGFEPASTAALVDDEHDYEPLSGLPRMSAVPVVVRAA
ncbi:MAG: molybdopterin dinucleotide binding domain-containing protein, partial [Planctomycetota bacterium]